MLLTTHFMDEADILGSRVAVLQKGRLQCIGTPMYLKQRFGAGYVLTLALSGNAGGSTSSDDEVFASAPNTAVHGVSATVGTITLSKRDEILSFVRSIVPSASLRSANGHEVEVQLPIDAAHSFAALFASLQTKLKDFGISGYGISITSLEQVFVSLAKHSGGHKASTSAIHDKHNESNPTVVSTATPSYMDVVRSIMSGNEEAHRDTRVTSVSQSVQSQRATIKSEEIRTIYGDVELTVPQNRAGAQTDGQGESDADEYDDDNFDLEHEGITWFSVKEYTRRLLRALRTLAIMILCNNRRTENSATDESTSIIPVVKVVTLATFFSTTKRGDARSPMESSVGVTSGWRRGLVQFKELLRKRYIIQSRDLSGLFFQVLFPALQILLILAILTLSIHPAGQSITMDANLYPKEPTTVHTNGFAATDSIHLNTTTGTLNASDIYTDYILSGERQLLDNQAQLLSSRNMSGWLLGNGSNALFDYRMSGYVFGDLIPVDLEVNWTWVSENLELILNTTSKFDHSAFKAIEAAGFNTITINSSTPLPGLISSDESYALTFTDIEYNSATGEVILINVTAVGYPSGQVYQLGDVSVPVELLATAFPDETIMYHFDIISPITIMHNSSSPHAIAAFDGEVMSSLFSKCSAEGVYSSYDTASWMSSSATYESKNHPLPLTDQRMLRIQVILSIFAAILILIPLCYLPAAFVTFIVRERVSKAKHLQLASSVSPLIYWITTYVWDVCLFILLIGCIVGAMFVYGEDAAKVFIGDTESLLAIVLLLFTYGVSVIPLCYLYSFYFSNHSTAQISIMVWNFLTGFGMLMAYFIMASISSLESLGEALVHLFRFFPPFNVGEGLLNIARNYYYNYIFEHGRSGFHWEVSGRNSTFMAVEAVGYFLAVLIAEYETWHDVARIWAFVRSKDWLRVEKVGSNKQSLVSSNLDMKAVPDASITTNDVELVSLNKTRVYDDADSNLGGACKIVEAPHRNQVISSISTSTPPPTSSGTEFKDIEGEDIDVRNERRIAHTTSPQDAVVLLKSVDKKYSLPWADRHPLTFIWEEIQRFFGYDIPIANHYKHAVIDFNLCIPAGECFGLLGVNGAGKTTTLSMLTGDLNPTSGDAYICGRPLSDHQTKYYVGYCPQTDPLLDLMTGWEVLEFFGRIRGDIPEDVLQERILELTNTVGLGPHIHKNCSVYSGGNKRKLSLAISLIGDPAVLFLDEVSSRELSIYVTY
jgi:ABC-type multidrug transport system ATPase subunit